MKATEEEIKEVLRKAESFLKKMTLLEQYDDFEKILKATKQRDFSFFMKSLVVKHLKNKDVSNFVKLIAIIDTPNIKTEQQGFDIVITGTCKGISFQEDWSGLGAKDALYAFLGKCKKNEIDNLNFKIVYYILVFQWILDNTANGKIAQWESVEKINKEELKYMYVDLIGII